MQGRDFYAVFMSGDEYRVVERGGRAIGSIPDTMPFIAGHLVILAGRRWQILEVDGQRKEISVCRAHGGQPPAFGGDPVPPSEGVVQAMRLIYETISVPPFLDATAIALLREARESFDRLGLRHGGVCRHEDTLLLFPWAGPRKVLALQLALTKAGLEPEPLGLALAIPNKFEAQLRYELSDIASASPPDALILGNLVKEKASEKYDRFLGDDLLSHVYACERIDRGSLPALAADLSQRWITTPDTL